MVFGNVSFSILVFCFTCVVSIANIVHYLLLPFIMYVYLLLLQVQKLSKNEVLMVNIGSLSTGGKVSAVKADLAKIALTQPVCTEVGEKIALSRRVEKHWRYALLLYIPLPSSLLILYTFNIVSLLLYHYYCYYSIF